jgi:hypothetical protein
MKKENKSMIVYIIIGIIIGYLSQMGRNLYGESGNYIAVSLALIFLVATAEINKKAFKIDKEFKWFWSNGGWVYLFVWFITWIIFFNPPFSPL